MISYSVLDGADLGAAQWPGGPITCPPGYTDYLASGGAWPGWNVCMSPAYYDPVIGQLGPYPVCADPSFEFDPHVMACCPPGGIYDGAWAQCRCKDPAKKISDDGLRCECGSNSRPTGDTCYCPSPYKFQDNADGTIRYCGCPDGKALLPDGTCPLAAGEAQRACPEGWGWADDLQKCCPPETVSNGYDCVCSDSKKRLNASGTACICAPGSIPQPGGGCACKGHMGWDQLNPLVSGAEDCTCPPGSAWSVNDCYCTDPKQRMNPSWTGCICAAPAFRNEAGACECPAPMVWVDAGGGAQKCACPAGQEYVNGQCACTHGVWSPSFKACKVCDTDQVWLEEQGRCVTAAASGPACPQGFREDEYGNCVVRDCSPGFVRNTDGRCVQQITIAAECPAGTHEDANGNCVEDAPVQAGMFGNWKVMAALSVAALGAGFLYFSRRHAAAPAAHV